MARGQSLELLDRLLRVWGRCRRASRRYRCSSHSIACRLIGLYVRRGLRPIEALEAGLGDPALDPAVIDACFAKQELVALQDRLNPQPWILLTEDKSTFYPYCQALGLPVPATFAVVSLSGGWLYPGIALTSPGQWAAWSSATLPSSFVVKPAAGVYGEAISVWRRDQDGILNHTGRQATFAALLDELRSHSKYNRFVVQERLANHEAIVALTACQALQTVRIATLLDESGEPHLLYAEWKLIVGSHVSDNFMRGRNGNLMANVSLATGEIGPGRAPAKDGVGFDAVPFHPVTHLPLAGFRLPQWPQLCELVLRAARMFAPVRTIGWDVALTASGPVLVEGNRWWDPPNDALTGPPAPGVASHELVAAVRLLRAAAMETAGK